MITVRRTVAFPAKNFAAALSWSRDVAAYCKSKFGMDMELQVPYGGNPNRFCYVMKYENLAAMEQAVQKSMSDPKFLEMYAKSTDVLTSGSAIDEIWTTL